MIKLPDAKVLYEINQSSEAWIIAKNLESSGWNECLAEVQRLNATAQPVSDKHARIADALESLLWPNMASGNKDVILCAINALRGIPAASGGNNAET